MRPLFAVSPVAGSAAVACAVADAAGFASARAGFCVAGFAGLVGSAGLSGCEGFTGSGFLSHWATMVTSAVTAAEGSKSCPSAVFQPLQV